MYKNSRENIHREEQLEYIMLSLLSNKINVLIIGGGEASLIKTKTFLKGGCNVTIVAKEFLEDFKSLQSNRLHIIKGEYDESLLNNCHIVILAIDDSEKINEVKKHCDKRCKIYINCKDYKDGMGAVPINIKSEEAIIGINTLKGNPKALKMMSNDFKDKLKSYDKFIETTSIIRNNAKKFKEKKKEILNFIVCDDFKDVIEKDMGKTLLKMFYENELVDELFKD